MAKFVSCSEEDPRRNLENKRFGKLVVTRCITDKTKQKGYSRLVWEAKCDCGKTVTVLGVNLINNSTKSCGCMGRGQKKLELLGKRFGKLVVTKFLGIDCQYKTSRQSLWECTCDCGNKIHVHGSYLTHGFKTSCGCEKKPYKLKVDLLGVKFDDWTVTSRAENRTTPNGQSRPCWTCTNSKGETKTVFATYIVQKLKQPTRKKNYTGQQFGKLRVLFEVNWEKTPEIEILNPDGTKKIYIRKESGRYWWCECECGNRIILTTNDLKKARSCGCGNGNKDITGEKFGKLTVLSYEGKNKRGVSLWKCQCECGNQKVIPYNGLQRGSTSCGCSNKRKPKEKKKN